MSIAPLQASSFTIKTVHGKFLKATPDGQLAVADQAQGWEQFTIEPVKAAEKVVHIKGAHGQYVCVEGETKVTANRPAPAQWESFELIPTAGANPFDGAFQGSLRSKHTNKFLSAQPDGHMEANRDAAGAWELFTFHREGAAPSYNIKSVHGKFVCAHPEGHLSGQEKAQAWEKYQIEPVKAGDKSIKIKGAHGQHLCVEGETKVVINRKDVGQWETFEFVPAAGVNPLDDSFAGFLKSKHTNKFLSVQPDGHLEANRDAAGAWETLTFSRTQ